MIANGRNNRLAETHGVMTKIKTDEAKTMGPIESRMDALDVERMMADDRVEQAVREILVELARVEATHPKWPRSIVNQVVAVFASAASAKMAAFDMGDNGTPIDSIRAELIQTAAMCIRGLINMEG